MQHRTDGEAGGHGSSKDVQAALRDLLGRRAGRPVFAHEAGSRPAAMCVVIWIA